MYAELQVSADVIDRCERILRDRRDPEWFVDRETVILILCEAFPDVLRQKEPKPAAELGRVY